MALNVPDLFKEINEIVERGVPKPKILVSDRAQIVMPYHILFDQYEEERLAGKSFGSTKSGIAPFIRINMPKLASRFQSYLTRNAFGRSWKIYVFKKCAA